MLLIISHAQDMILKWALCIHIQDLGILGNSSNSGELSAIPVLHDF